MTLEDERAESIRGPRLEKPDEAPKPHKLPLAALAGRIDWYAEDTFVLNGTVTQAIVYAQQTGVVLYCAVLLS